MSYSIVVKRGIATTLILGLILFAACGMIAPMPTIVATTTPHFTSNNLSSTLALAQPSFTPPTRINSPIITTSTTAESIRLYHNQIASRTIRDEYSFSVVVMEKEADFVPKSIQIIEEGTNRLIGQYELFNETEIQSLCASLLQNPDFEFYETALIDYSELPKGFVVRAYEGDFIFRITDEHLSGRQEVIEIKTPLDVCYSAVQ